MGKTTRREWLQWASIVGVGVGVVAASTEPFVVSEQARQDPLLLPTYSFGSGPVWFMSVKHADPLRPEVEEAVRVLLDGGRLRGVPVTLANIAIQTFYGEDGPVWDTRGVALLKVGPAIGQGFQTIAALVDALRTAKHA